MNITRLLHMHPWLHSISRQFSLQFCFPWKMSSGRSSHLTRDSRNRRETDVGVRHGKVGGPWKVGRHRRRRLPECGGLLCPTSPKEGGSGVALFIISSTCSLASRVSGDGVDERSSPDISTGAKGGYSHVRWKMCQRKNGKFPSTSAGVVSAKRRIKIDLRTELEQRSEESPGDIVLSRHEAVSNLRSKEDSLLPTSFGKKSLPFPPKQRKLCKTNFAQGLPLLESFDICLSEVGRSSSQNASLDAKNANLIEMNHPMKIAGQVLRPGMVLLKSYITLSEQVDIVKKCQKLGIGHGGFYQPGYGDGVKLRLQMMCLGLDWDPQTRTYQNKRAVDGSEPHAIPLEFCSLVKETIQYSHGLMQKNHGLCNVEDVLPVMSPNICIVNFYTTSGRLGLHQDRDESKESLEKGLPVVSFSVGDSAEFLYGDQRDVDKAEKVLLESGDVLIFDGMSRHIFHGVPFIVPNSAPSDLLEEANLRPGRLNLTFRQF